jgi:hypothetical protein
MIRAEESPSVFGWRSRRGDETHLANAHMVETVLPRMRTHGQSACGSPIGLGPCAIRTRRI